MMYVIKRDGSRQEFKLENIQKQVNIAAKGLKVNPDELIMNTQILMKDDITTKEIQNALIVTAEQKLDWGEYDWTYMAARLRLYDLYHSIENYYGVPGSGDVYKKVSLKMYVDKHRELMNEWVNKYTAEELEELNNVIDGERDLLWDNMGVQTVIERYLFRVPLFPCSWKDIEEGKADYETAKAKNELAYKYAKIKLDEDGNKTLTAGNIIVELPQHLHMMVAMFSAQNEKDRVKWAKAFYEELSSLRFIASTPINAFSRNKNGSTASCFVGTMGDNLLHIFETFKEVGLGSAAGGGWGVYINKLRGLSSWINGNPGMSSGIVPNTKVLSDISVYIDQGGRRKGAFNAFLEVWHIDLKRFIRLRRKEGDERMRAQDLFLSICVNDLFMERVEDFINNPERRKDITWTLFDPYDVPNLDEVYGEEFKKLYLHYEEKFKADPSFFNINTRSVPMAEILTDICKSYFEEGMPFIFFKDKTNELHQHKHLGLIRSSNLCMEFMNPTSEDEISVCNLGSINFAKLDTDEQLYKTTSIAIRFLDNLVDTSSYKSEKAKKTQKERRSVGLGILGEHERLTKEKIYFGSSEHGQWIDQKYSIFRKAIDETNIELAQEKGSCIIPGIRCAYTSCIAPNTTSGLMASTTNSTEPVYGKMWVEDNKISTKKMMAPGLNLDNSQYYTTAFELDQKKMIDMTAIRQKYIDMGISHSIYVDYSKHKDGKVDGSYLINLMIHAWKKGLKSLYYLRSRQVSNEGLESKESKIKCEGCEN